MRLGPAPCGDVRCADKRYVSAVCGVDKDAPPDKDAPLWYTRARIAPLALDMAGSSSSTNTSSSSHSHSTGISDSASFASGPLPPVLEITTLQ